nr:NADAR family protein [Pseudomonas luteola]
MTLFFSEKDVFSNWYRSDFVVKGIRFNCVEQFMMYCKAKLFADEATANKILEAGHPRDQKVLG